MTISNGDFHRLRRRRWTAAVWTAVLFVMGMRPDQAFPIGAGPAHAFLRRVAVACHLGAETDPLVISADHHWFEFRGHKVLLVGDSVTQGWMELGANFNQNAYVDALASRGINVLMLWSYIGITDQVGDSRIGYDAPEIWPWVRTGATFDLNQLNEAYFDRLRALVMYANTKDIVVLITIHDGWTKTRFAGHPFNQALGGPLTSNSQYVELADYNNEMPATYNPAWTRQQKNQYFQERLCARLIQATADQPNVIYEMFNEGEWYNQTNLRALQVHFLRFFKSRSARVTMVNDDHIGGAGFRGEADCDSISLHQPNWTASTTVTASFERFAPEFTGTPAKPFFFSEPVPEYQGDASWHDALMRLMWGTLLGGAGFVVQNDTSFGFDPNAAMAAESVDRDTVLDLEGHAARFFNASGIPFWELTPDGTLASSGVCLANPGQAYAAYSQSGSSLTVNLPNSSYNMVGRFFNPRTGVFQPSFNVTGTGPRAFTKPGSGDWVLHLAAGVVIPGDFDFDEDVDMEDFAHFQLCLGESGMVVTDPNCFDASLDPDGDIDGNDFAVFLGCMSGPNLPADPGCAN